MALQQMHGCGARHVGARPVHEVFEGQTVWRGIVDIFELTGHPKAKRAYAWSHAEGKEDDKERFVTVLELPPVVSPETAVRAATVAKVKGKGGKV